MISEMKNTNEMYKIKEVTENHILFTNGSEMTYDHEPECCENNYADFEQLDDLARNATFSGDMKFESTECGFRFGTDRMYFVPCYSKQNGYYTDCLDIYYNGERILCVEAEEIIC